MPRRITPRAVQSPVHWSFSHGTRAHGVRCHPAWRGNLSCMYNRGVWTALAFALLIQVRVLAVLPQASAPVSPASAAFTQAVQLHDAGQFAEAIPLFKQAVALGYQPINQARFRLARAYAR